MTKINELKLGMKVERLEASIKYMTPPRDIHKYGRKIRLVNFVLADDTGEIEATAWNEMANLVKIGAKVIIEGAQVTSWNDKLQISFGKFGMMTAK